MTKPSEGQFSNLCEVCKKPMTAGHSHDGQTPEEIARQLFGDNPGTICAHCGLPGTEAQHAEHNLHALPGVETQTCVTCGQPGSHVGHEIDGTHEGVTKGTCPVCNQKIYPGHNHTALLGVTNQKKYGAIAAVLATEPEESEEGAEGEEVPKIASC